MGLQDVVRSIFICEQKLIKRASSPFKRIFYFNFLKFPVADFFNWNFSLGRRQPIYALWRSLFFPDHSGLTCLQRSPALISPNANAMLPVLPDVFGHAVYGEQRKLSKKQNAELNLWLWRRQNILTDLPACHVISFSWLLEY